MSEQYPGTWKESMHVPIAQALVAQRIKGCGQFEYKLHSMQTESYLVRCTPDGTNWTFYFVDTEANIVEQLIGKY